MKKQLLTILLLFVGLSLWAQPSISSFSPASGPVGTEVTITGTNFNTTAADNVVFFGATKATVTTASATSLTVTVPDGANYRCITVTDKNAGRTAYSAQPFVVTFSSSGKFAAKADYTTGTSPYNVTTCDFNGDGIPDLATANYSNSSISVLLGKGDRTFNAKVDYSTVTSPYCVTTGDFNGDGIPDLATANASDNTVSVLLGKGDGTFNTKVDYPSGLNPRGATTGDFNGDGIPDLATANSDDNKVSVLLGKGDGTFNAKVDYATGSKPQNITMGDFDGDGKLDLVTANYSPNTVSVLLGNGNGTFAAKADYNTGSSPRSVATGDFNGDGIPDLAAANTGNGMVSVLMGAGDGTFNPKVDYPTGASPYCVTTGDLNGDGIPDLATANANDNMVSVLTGKGDGTFNPKVDYPTGTIPESVTTGDFNGDGRTDLVIANISSNTVSVLKNLAWPPAISSFSPASGPVGTEVTITGTNFNTTAADNVVFFGATKATVTAATATSLTVTVPVGATYQYISVSDMNSGFTAYSAQPFVVTFADGYGNFGMKVNYPTGTYALSVAIGDLDGDGKPDLAVANYSSNNVSVLRNTGSAGSPSFAAKVDYPTGTNPYSVAIGDLDGDGKPDLAVTNNSSATVSVLRNTGSAGSPSFAAKVDYPTGTYPQSVSIGDLDGDGKPDLAVANGGSNNISVLRNTGSAGSLGFATKADYPTGTIPYSVAIGDLDGDGKSDLVVPNYSSATVSVLRNTGSAGSPSFATKVDYPTGTNPQSVAIGDLDGDGKPDLAVANGGSATVSVLLNTGSAGSPALQQRSIIPPERILTA